MRVAVVGAGLAGLACAVDLTRAGVDVTVFEARTRVGGRAWSDVMPDGARFERGGEFVEAGYDDFRRRAREHGLPFAAHGFAFAAREVRWEGEHLPALLLEAEAAIADSVHVLGAGAAAASAAEVLERAPLDPLSRLALLRRLEGTYTVELDRVSASWLVAMRAGQGEEAPSARLAAGNDALAAALAAELGERVRCDCAVGALHEEQGAVAVAAPGVSDHFDRAVLALPLPLGLSLLPSLRERSSYARLVFGTASKLHVPLAQPAPPAAVQSLEAAFWTWTASGAAGTPATIASSFAGGLHAHVALAIEQGPERWRAALQELRPELAFAEGAVLTRWEQERHSGGSYACHPPGWTAQDDAAVAAPHGRIHLAGEHTAGEFCGTLEGALRSGARAASEVLAKARSSG
jgi:monoamine oxidase